MRKRASLLLVVMMLSTFLLAAPAAAEPVAYLNPSPFVDLSTGHWAISSIVEMNQRAVVNGYTDGTFQPDSPVRQIEAVLMAVRSMGETNAIKAIDSNRTLAVEVPQWVLDDYKRELLFAVDKGLIVPSEKNFAADTYASRAWMAQLIVRMVGKNNEAVAAGKVNTGFTDNSSIPVWAVPYVDIAVDYNIIKGYPDGSFGPSNNVTRAETATLLTRTDALIPALKDVILLGTITGINDNLFTVGVGSSSMKLSLLTTSWGFDVDGKVKSWTKFTTGTNVKMLVSGTNVVFIQEIKEDVEAVDLPPVTEIQAATSVTGTIRSTVEGDRLLVYADDGGQLITEQLGAAIKLTNLSGSPIAFSQLLVGATIKVGYDRNGAVVSVQMMNATGSYGGDGYIYSIDEKGQLIIIKDANGGFTTYEYASDLVVNIANVRFPTVSDLEVGDMVSLTVKDKVLIEIELVEAQQQLKVTGEIIGLSTVNNNVSIKSSSGSALYYLAKDAKIEIDGLNVATVHDLKEGDNVTAEVNNGLITLLEVLNRDAGSYYSGTVLAVDTSNKKIVIQTNNGETVSYDLGANVTVEIDGEYEEISDVKADMEVDLTVVDDKVLYIEVASGAEGKVISINTTRNLISVQLNNGSSDSYVYSSDVDVNFTTISKPDEFDIAVGDTVRIHTNVDGLVYQIDVYCTAMFEVVAITGSSDRLKVEDEDGDSRYLYLDDHNVTIEMAGVRNPTVDDFSVGDVLEVSFMGNDLRKIVVMETVVGTIAAINDATGVFSVTDYDGIAHSFTFTNKSTITDASKTSGKLSAMAVGDRAQVYENIDGDLEISLMTLVTGTIVSVGTDYESVYIQKTGTSSYSRYYVEDDCLLTENGSELAWRNLTMGDKVRLYTVGTTAYEIERY